RRDRLAPCTERILNRDRSALDEQGLRRRRELRCRRELLLAELACGLATRARRLALRRIPASGEPDRRGLCRVGRRQRCPRQILRAWAGANVLCRVEGRVLGHVCASTHMDESGGVWRCRLPLR